MAKSEEWYTGRRIRMKQAMCGWRAKIGVLTPPNYCIISEWGYVTPAGVTFVPALMGLGDATPEGLKEMRQWAVTESKKLADWEVDIILFGCTSGSFVGGAGYDEDIIEEVQKAVGIPTTTTTTCVLTALDDLGVKKIALLGPYLEEVFDLEVEFLMACGIETRFVKALGYREVHDFVHLYEQPYLFYGPAKEAYRSAPDADAIFITCMASPALEIIDILERETGKPVFSSCSASLYGVMKKLGIREPIEKYGTLGKRLGEG